MLTKKPLLLVAHFLAAFTVLPVLVPVFAYLGWEGPADAIYWVYQWFCHQRPWRSYHMFDFQYAMDARMMLMFGSMAIAAYLIYFKKIKPLRTKTALLFALILILPLAIDGTTQAIAEVMAVARDTLPFYESTNFIRSLTGLLLGTGVAFSMFPYLDLEVKGYSKLRDIIKGSLLTGVLSFLLILIFTFLWFITSAKYKPGSPLVDNVQRFPGYNYEITESAGHSTIGRTLRIDEVRLYLKRAKKYDKKTLMDEYYESVNGK